MLCCQKTKTKKTNHPFSILSLKVLNPSQRKRGSSSLFKTTFIPICDECLYRFPININVWSYMKIRYSVKRLYSILNPLNIFMAVHLVSEKIGAKSVLLFFLIFPLWALRDANDFSNNLHGLFF